MPTPVLRQCPEPALLASFETFGQPVPPLWQPLSRPQKLRAMKIQILNVEPIVDLLHAGFFQQPVFWIQRNLLYSADSFYQPFFSESSWVLGLSEEKALQQEWGKLR